MDNVMSIIFALLVFGIIVFVHELGHFLFAIKSGIFVEEFAIGMGPKLIGFERKGTFYSLRVLPIGGYCKMLGEDEVVDDARAFSSKPVGARILTVFGGALFNFILAFIAAAITIVAFGATSTIVQGTMPDYPAVEAGIKAGDEVVKVNGKRIFSYEEMSIYVNSSKGNPLELEIKQGDTGEKVLKTVTPKLVDKEYYYIGVQYGRAIDRDFFSIIKHSAYKVISWIRISYFSLGELMRGRIPARDISGPVGIVDVVGTGYREGVKDGVMTVVAFALKIIIILSSNIGVMNLLPLPALDGGRLMFLFIELIRKKPVDQEKEGFVHFVGIVLLMGVMLLTVFNDISRMIQ